MLRWPRSLNVHAIADPAGAAMRLSGNGNERICSSVNVSALVLLCAVADRCIPPAVQTDAIAAAVVRKRAMVIITANYNDLFLLESFLADVRYALRWLRKSPAFTVVAVASLTIGIGFNTALFAVIDALLFKPLPVAAPERLVDVFTSDSSGTVRFSTSSYADYLDLKSQAE